MVSNLWSWIKHFGKPPTSAPQIPEVPKQAPTSFLDYWKAGLSKNPKNDVADFVKKWNQDPSVAPSLADHLGLTQAQYAEWVLGKRSLEDILREIHPG
jgi:hypothetical protein